MVRYPPLVLSFTQAHLCDIPFCNVSQDHCATPHKNKHERVLRYYRCWASSAIGEGLLCSTHKAKVFAKHGTASVRPYENGSTVLLLCRSLVAQPFFAMFLSCGVFPHMHVFHLLGLVWPPTWPFPVYIQKTNILFQCKIDHRIGKRRLHGQMVPFSCMHTPPTPSRHLQRWHPPVHAWKRQTPKQLK